MGNDDFRRELNAAFEEMSGSPSPALRDRVRSAVGQAPTARGPYWIAAVAACLIAAVIVGVLYVNSPLRRSTSTAGPVASPSATQAASPAPSATPSSQLPAFVCASSTTSSVPSNAPVVFITSLRTGTHQGYDRLTIDFGNGDPSAVELKPQSDTKFTASPSGLSVTIKGTKGILVVVHGADLHSSYNGPVDIVTGYGTLVEVRRIEDFEGVVQLALGVNGTGCYRAFWLTNPDRLVIDVQAAT